MITIIDFSYNRSSLLKNVSKNKENEVENLVINVFKKLISEGIPESTVNASLHQIEIKLKKVGAKIRRVNE